MPNSKLFIPDALEGTEIVFCFKPARAGVFNEDFPPNFFETSVERVAPEEATAIVLPNNFRSDKGESEAYIKEYADMAERLGVPVYIFSLGDFTDHLRFDPRVKVFISSVYRSEMPPNVVVIPALCEDKAKSGIVMRAKSDKPRVSFCGMGGFSTWLGWVKYFIKNLRYDLASLVQANARAHKIGVYWRITMMAACAKSPLVSTFFIVRKTFSGNQKTIELDPHIARREFMESIVGSDFVLAPKGDGNYSNRFFETLSVGRIPVVVDTDIVLPLEDRIDYAKIMVRVPMSDVANTPIYIKRFYDSLSEEEWRNRQQLARETFEKYLRMDSFFKQLFLLQ